ncbi:hypothetical protein BDR06DRAFT_200999 [Suillus hirtellus]|nr:hypothetical protein BDR06DRAFT_200999 [Suillus hirtellus]
MVCHLSSTVVSASDRPTEWALPDQLVFSTVSALLHICGAHPEHADRAVTSIINFVTDIVQNLKDSGSIDVLTHLTPSIHQRIKRVQLNAKKKEIVDTDALIERYRKEIEDLKNKLSEREAEAPS